MPRFSELIKAEPELVDYDAAVALCGGKPLVFDCLKVKPAVNQHRIKLWWLADVRKALAEWRRDGVPVIAKPNRRAA